MAIYKETFKKVGSNTASIDKGANVGARWPTMLRVRMSDAEMSKYGACNTFRLVNTSTVGCWIRFGWNIENGNPKVYLMPNGILNFTVDDGISGYGFDVENEGNVTDIAIGEFSYSMSRVEQLPEK